MPPVDDRTAALCAAAAAAVARMVDAIRHDDREALAAQIGALLTIVTKLARSERQIADAALTRAVARLGR